MIVYIESLWGDRLISGKKCTEKELREKFEKVIKIAEKDNFTELFCRIFKFDEYPLLEDIEADFVIDLDINKIYAPRR